MLLVEDPDREKLYLRNNMVLEKSASRIGMPRFLSILVSRFSFLVSRNTRNIEDFAIQIAICLGPKYGIAMYYCNLL